MINKKISTIIILFHQKILSRSGDIRLFRCLLGVTKSLISNDLLNRSFEKKIKFKFRTIRTITRHNPFFEDKKLKR